ncbi:hypothetical protein PAERUG_P64_East_of_England_6_01_14_00080 [Pseudomonas aeruginosa]|nr:hypothetical protein PAERUG_P64_East_of_England_6_01_14_00080 [Pseudomonas aeruginosa]
MGSEMCIRDSEHARRQARAVGDGIGDVAGEHRHHQDESRVADRPQHRRQAARLLVGIDAEGQRQGDQQAARDHHRQHERHPGQQVLVHPALLVPGDHRAGCARALDLPFRQRPLERRAGLLEGHAGAATVDLLAGETGRVHVDVGGQQDHVGGGDVRRVERVARADRALGLDLQREAQLPRRELQRLGGHEGVRHAGRTGGHRDDPRCRSGLRRNQAGLVPGDLHARQGGGPLEEGARIGQRLGGTRAIHRLADETRRRQRLDADQQDPVGFGDLFGAQFALGPRPGIRLDAGFPAQALGGAPQQARGEHAGDLSARAGGDDR